jgi:hypothetical protein
VCQHNRRKDKCKDCKRAASSTTVTV